MATITVTTAADVVAADGVRSLREAAALANATPETDTIVFLSALEGRTLTLTQGEISTTGDVAIDGDRNNDGTEVTLSGGDQSRILHVVGEGTDASLSDLTLTHGRTTDFVSGGAILGDSGTSLLLNHAMVRDNHATDGSAGILGSSITLTNSTVVSNI